jgi:hypothetical protein
MAKRIWFAGKSVDNERPVWAPLLAVVGALADRFMWMYEVVLEDGRSIHAYKHSDTRRYLHLGPRGNAWMYRHRQGRSMYRTIDLAGALIEVFGCLDDGGGRGTGEERPEQDRAGGGRDDQDRSDNWREVPAGDGGDDRDAPDYSDGRDDQDAPECGDGRDRRDGRDDPDDRGAWDGRDDGRLETRAMVATVIEAARSQGSSPVRRPVGAPTVAVAVEIDAALIERARLRVPPEPRLTDEATVEHAIAMFALDRELLHGGYQGVLSDADAGRLLLDELHQTGRDADGGAHG